MQSKLSGMKTTGLCRPESSGVCWAVAFLVHLTSIVVDTVATLQLLLLLCSPQHWELMQD